jgi:elongation factor 1 alpha-like protein
VEVTDKKTGEVLKKKPRCLTKNQSATVEVAFDLPICIDLFTSSKTMGRFMLRYGGKTIAAGMVTQLL